MNRNIILLFTLALLLRLLFSFYFQQFYFGSFEFKYGDGLTYLNPILNLINLGEYRGDIYFDDSKYFRPPLYPMILGIFYILSSISILDYVIASFQCIIGAVSALLIYYIILNITGITKAAIISSFVYASYPFSILWTPLMYTETVQWFLMLLLIYLSTNGKINILSTILQGSLVGLIFLTKQYLAIIIIIPIYLIIFNSLYNKIHKIIHLLVLIFSFSLTLSPWIVRNYISSGQVIVFFGKTSGLRNTLDDHISFIEFANKFDENTTKYVKSVVETGVVKFTKHPNFLLAHDQEISEASLLAYQCGGSFQQRRLPIPLEQPPYQNCNQEVVQKFNSLSNKFWREVPLWEALETRRDGLWKIVTKSDLVNNQLIINKYSSLKFVLFKYRLLLLLLGFSGMLYLLSRKDRQYLQRRSIESIMITAMVFYLFFSLILVAAEMRYFLTPDLWILLFAGVIPAVLVKRILAIFKNLKNGTK